MNTSVKRLSSSAQPQSVVFEDSTGYRREFLAIFARVSFAGFTVVFVTMAFRALV